MARPVRRRNILRELTSVADQSADSLFLRNTVFPLTPTSPEESIIRRQGLRKKPATYTYDAPDPVFFKTPTKSPKKANQRLYTPTKLTPVRSSPRKRLNLTPDKTPEAGISEISISKRFKRGRLQNVKLTLELKKTIKALSRAQLLELLYGAINLSPETEKVFEELIPVPDLSPVEERLSALQRNVYKSFPRNVFGAQNAPFCFLRVRTHLEAFKKECLDLCLQFMDSQHWSAVFEYIFIALRLVVGLPDWSSESHNKIKKTCMKQLVAHCITALKKSRLDALALAEIKERMQEFEENMEAKSCIKFIEDLMQNNA